jgi:hypothetical protein
LHGPEELGYPPLTEAMVNIRGTLTEAERSGILAAEFAARLTGIAKSGFYKARTYETVLQAAAAAGLPPAALRDFGAWLSSGRIDQKRRDAEAILCVIRAHLAAALPPLRVSYTLAETAAWQAARVRSQCRGNAGYLAL